MVAQRAGAECYLLHFVGDDHVEDSLGACFDVISHEYFLLTDIPHLQVVCAGRKQVISFVKSTGGYWHSVTFCFPYLIERSIQIEYPGGSIKASRSHQTC